MSFVIRGIGTATPPRAIEQQRAATLASSYAATGALAPRTVAALFRRSGVKSRHSIVLDDSRDGEEATQSFYWAARSPEDRGPTTAERMERYAASAADLAVAAARRAMENGGIESWAVRHLVTVSCSGFCAPGFDVALIESLSLPRDSTRTHVGFMGCHGAFNGLRVAHALSSTDPAVQTLVCAVELCSLHYQYGDDPQQVVANSLFADGAAAVVGGSDPGNRDRHRWALVENESVLLPESRDLMGWQIGDHGFRMHLSPAVPDIIHAELATWMQSWLARRGLAIEDIGSWAVHPGGPRILQAVAESLGLAHSDLNASRGVLERHGNMSSPTILFVLEELRRRGAAPPCVLLGFGPGLAIEAALVSEV